MKKTLFLLMLLVSIPVFFTGCAEDMYEDSTSLEDLYRQKAAEFSRKYGVEVTLNEEKISEIVATKSLEELEAEIREIADFFSGLTINIRDRRPTLKQKMRIRKTKTLSEESVNQTGSFECDFMYSGTVGNGSSNISIKNADGHGKVDWNFKTNTSVSLEVEIRPNFSTTIFQGSHFQNGIPASFDQYGVKFGCNGTITLSSLNQLYNIVETYSISVNEEMSSYRLTFGNSYGQAKHEEKEETI